LKFCERTVLFVIRPITLLYFINLCSLGSGRRIK
jgi:hypothetical protein